eukprot:Ihof_evm3s55 gene=Ihof_evmTU3s55
MIRLYTITLIFMAVTLGYGRVKLQKPERSRPEITYHAAWESLDQRPNPSWWSHSKFSLNIDWGIFSVPAYCLVTAERMSRCDAEKFLYYSSRKGYPEHEYLPRRYGRDYNYTSFAREFQCELFDPKEWASVFALSGAKLVVVNVKSQDGFVMWDSAPGAEKSWSVRDIGPPKDTLDVLAKEIKNIGLRFGVKYSLNEWFNPKLHGTNPERYVQEIVQPQLQDIVYRFRPHFLFSDHGYGADSGFWGTKQFLAWLFTDSPVRDDVVVNDRWGLDATGLHGGVYTCEYTGEEGPSCIGNDPTHPWFVYVGMGISLGYNRLDIYNTITYFIDLLVRVIAHGGNLHLSVGPLSDGRLPPEQKTILEEMGVWIRVNAEAIYGTTSLPFPTLNNGCFRAGVLAKSEVCLTRSNDTIYAISLRWPGPTISFGSWAIAENNITATLVGTTIK